MTEETEVPPSPGTAQAAMAEAEARQARRRRQLAVVALPLVAVVGVTLWAWKPWQSAELPDRACWSTVTRADLAPLAGADGEATADESGVLSNGKAASCAVLWNGQKGNPLLHLSIQPQDEGALTYVQHLAADPTRPNRPRPLDFGPGTAAVITDDANVQLVYRCTGEGTSSRPVRQVLVSGGPVSGDGYSPEVRAAHVDLARRLASAAIDAEGCRTGVRVSAPPAVPGR
ncbi:hypothetical protein [Kitasatospora sp. NPDC050463]|uniref:hypothetical protein n=1 Tax=Kitasatospora sp. NPDC050463 TaxID=3155786 RepID=UPI0033FAA8E7